ncbi:MAG: T9SS type A sorting domain-containing protein [Bacteroidales bacterium]|jgi:hypothetical protein|nr:T9SS type A sorting domain-containing protein [Bacteroidales bacterium]
MKRLFFFGMALLFVASPLRAQQTILFSEGFETGGTGWTFVEDDYDNYPGSQWIIDTTKVKTGTHSAKHGGFSWDINKGFYISPQIALPSATAIKLSFWSFVQIPVSHGLSSVRIYTDTSSIKSSSNYTKVWGPQSYVADDNPLDNYDPWENVVLDISAFSGQNIYVVFLYEKGSTGYAHDWWIDDITVYSLKDNDVGITEIVSPKINVNLGEERVQLRVRNFGTQSISDIPVSCVVDGGAVVTETMQGPIPAQSEAIYTFNSTIDFSAAGTYDIKAFTGLTTDEDRTNDTIIAIARSLGSDTIKSFPFFEGFEDTATVRHFWKEVYHLDSTIARDTIKLPWYFVDGSLTIESRLIPHAHSGNFNACYSDWYVPLNAVFRHRTKLISPMLDLSSLAAPILEFYHATKLWGPGNMDTLKVHYKTSPGGEWHLIYTTMTPVHEWEKMVLALPEKSSTYYIAFEGITNIGASVVLDDVTVHEGDVIDVKVVEITAPQSVNIDLGMSEVSVRVQNLGTEKLWDIPLYFTINGILIASEVMSDTLNSLEEKEYTFTAPGNFVAEDLYALTVFSAMSGDNNTSNDSVTLMVQNRVNKAIMGLFPSVVTCGVDFYDDGVENDYEIGYTIETQQITFYPAQAGKRVSVNFDMINLTPFYLFNSYPIEGDSLIVYDGAEVLESRRITAFSDSMANVTVTSSSADGALTFLFIKQSAAPSPGWHGTVSCVNPPNKDVGIRRIITPVKGGSGSSVVSVEIKNYGCDTVRGLNVFYSFSTGVVSSNRQEYCPDTILPGLSVNYTFGKTCNMGAYRETYSIKVFTQLAGDENLSNDTASRGYFYRPDITLHGYRLWDGISSGYGAVRFNVNDADISVVAESDYQDDNTGVIVAGAVTSENIYTYTMDKAGSHAPMNFVKLDKSWNEISKVEISIIPADMTYDFTENVMYGVMYDNDYQSPLLMEINLDNGDMLQKSLLYSMSCIAVDTLGNMYGMSDNGYFCAIDKRTGNVTPVSHSGIYIASLFQSMTFDYQSNRLFWVSAERGKLFEINPATGEFTDFGPVGSYSEISCLFGSTPLLDVAIEPSNNVFSGISVYPNPVLEGRVFTIVGAATGDKILIYDLSGRLVKAAVGTGADVSLSGLRRGGYVIKVGTRACRIVVN